MDDDAYLGFEVADGVQQAVFLQSTVVAEYVESQNGVAMVIVDLGGEVYARRVMASQCRFQVEPRERAPILQPGLSTPQSNVVPTSS
jgi:hypothetical protein